MGTGPGLPGCVRAGVNSPFPTRRSRTDQSSQSSRRPAWPKRQRRRGAEIQQRASGSAQAPVARRIRTPEQPGRGSPRTRASRSPTTRTRCKSGARGPTLLEDFVLREKITHFDHERIPGAHRACARLRRARLLPADEIAVAADQGGVPAGPEEEDRGVRALLDRRGRRRLRRHAARRARLRGQVLHRGRQLRSRRQQHPGVLHSGRDQVSRPDPLGEDGAGSRLSAGGLRARHVLGLRVADAREHAHADVGDVGSRHPALAAHDRRLRRPHLPPDQCEGRVDLREVPLAAAARRGRRCIWDEAVKINGADPDFHRRDLFEAIAERRLPRMGILHPGLRPEDRRRASTSTCSIRPSSSPRRSCRSRSSARWCSTAMPTTSSPRPSRSAFHPGHVVPGIDFTNDPLLQGRLFSYTDTQLLRLGGPNFHELQINRPALPDAQLPARRHQAPARADRPRRLRAEQPRSRRPARESGTRLPHLRGAELRGRAGRQAAHPPGELRRSLQPGAAVLPLDVGAGAAPHRQRLRVRARQGRDGRDPHAHARSPDDHRRGARRRRRGGARHGRRRPTRSRRRAIRSTWSCRRRSA